MSRRPHEIFKVDEERWNELVECVAEHCRLTARLRKVSTYTETAAVLRRRTGLDLDFHDVHHRSYLSWLLGDAAERNLATEGAMLSAMVEYYDRNDVGPGFFAKAKELGILPKKATEFDCPAFWSSQMNILIARHSGAA